MAVYRCERTINADPERCYDVFTDLEAAPRNIDAITEVRWVSGERFEPGSRFAATREMFGKQHTEEMTVEAAERGKRYVLGADSSGSRFETVYTFEPKGSGTFVRQEMRCTPRTLAAKLMTPVSLLMGGAIRKALESDMDQLKKACEDGSAGG
jgi:uncharacterized protein YndB with AHSA1/START domain